MIAPNIWIDPRNGNDYFLNVQYPEGRSSIWTICTRFRCAGRSSRSPHGWIW